MLKKARAQTLFLVMAWSLPYVFLDGLTTLWLISRNGISGELNPVAVSIYAVAGILGLFIVKLVAAIVAGLAVLWIDHSVASHPDRRFLDYTLIVLIGTTSFIGLNNLAGALAMELFAIDLAKSSYISIIPAVLTAFYMYGAAVTSFGRVNNADRGQNRSYELSFRCGCYYRHDGKAILISAHGGQHPNIYFVIHMLPTAERLRVQFRLLVHQLVEKIVFKGTGWLRALHLAHPRTPTIADYSNSQ